jgi:Na+/H+-translocating membrane pyrophosphatase
MHNQKAQSAIEYLTTYGWAIMIVAIALTVMFYFGVFSPGRFVNTQCIFPADFSCLSSFMSTNGVIIVNIQQSTMYTINITAYGCNTQPVYTTMTTPANQITVAIGANKTLSVQCYNSTNAFSGSVGALFKGYVILNYTDLQTGFKKGAFGTVVEKVT